MSNPTRLEPGQPKGLGPDFGRLFASGSVSALGDGISLAAGPLLVASLTDQPLLVAGAAFVQQVPWLLFSLLAGVYVDRLDRRRLLIAVNILLASATGGLAVALLLDRGTLPVIYVALFILGTGETVSRNAGGAMLPSVVTPDQLPRANARIYASYTLGMQLIGPPLGAALFVLAPSVPFAVDGASFLVAALLLRRLRLRVVERPTGARPSVGSEIREGLAWLWRHPMLRLVAICIAVMNLTFGGTMAVFVLYAREQLGVGPHGYGLLLGVSAVGGLIGARIVPDLELRFGTAVLLRAGLLVEAGTQLALGLTHHAWTAAAVMLVFGVHATVWGVVTASIRQRVVPDELRGRIGGVYLLFSAGGMALGSGLGGIVAQVGGISAPYLVAAAGVGALTVVVWRSLDRASR